jgi:hypothetical protein
MLQAINNWENRKEVIYAVSFLAICGAYVAGAFFPNLVSGFAGFATAIMAWMSAAIAGHITDAKLNP